MCTALSIKTTDNTCFFGRNMDLAYQFNQSVMIIPRNYPFKDIVTGEMIINNRAIMGMGTVIDEHPVLADAMNENGLACAGLNFAGYAYFEKACVPGKINLAPYDFIQWVLSNHDTVEEVKRELSNIELVDVPINDKTPISMLHWMIADQTGQSIVVEKTKDKIFVHDNPVGVLTNNPPFDWHLTNLNEYMFLKPEQPKETRWSDQPLTALGIGAGTLGIPGDFASVSRFIRIAYIRANMPAVQEPVKAMTQFFNMLDYVKMVRGGARTAEGLEDLTLYASCMNQAEGIYYYRTYDNNRINAVAMHKEDLDAKAIKKFEYQNVQDINCQN